MNINAFLADDVNELAKWTWISQKIMPIWNVFDAANVKMFVRPMLSAPPFNGWTRKTK